MTLTLTLILTLTLTLTLTLSPTPTPTLTLTLPLPLALTLTRRNSNLLRLDKLSKRPLPEPSSGIGLWDLLLKFTASFAVLINCMLVAVSTDQLDYFSCYSQSLFRDQGECTRGNVPMTSRFLIAAVAGYVILAIVFLIDNTLPDQQEG